MKIKMDEGAILPTRAHATDAGLDLYSRDDKTLYAMKCDGVGSNLAFYLHGGECFDTGVHIELPPGYYGKIESKSGLNVKHNVVSCGGVIDEGYTGSIVVKLYNFGDTIYQVHRGDKIAQLVIMPYAAPDLEVVDSLEETERGESGFGSTGR